MTRLSHRQFTTEMKPGIAAVRCPIAAKPYLRRILAGFFTS